MMSSRELEQNISDYLTICSQTHRKPSYFTFGQFLAVSPSTIRHVCNGYYASGRAYTDKPHINRVIDNGDFEMVREVFRD